MFRRLLLYLSERRGLQRFILRRELSRRVAHRFVAGENLDTAIEATRELNGRGMKVALDRLGESVDSREQAERAAGEYIAALERIERQKLDAGISIKLRRSAWRSTTSFAVRTCGRSPKQQAVMAILCVSIWRVRPT